MIKISKREYNYLTKVAKIGYGGNGIFRTNSHNRSYYLCESEHNKELLRRYSQKKEQDQDH